MKRFIILIISLIFILGCSLPSTIPVKTTLTAPLSTDAPAIPTQTSIPSQTPTAKPITCTVNAMVLNFREGPSTSNNIIKWLDHKVELTIVKRDGAWLKVISSTGEIGFVHSKYCK